MCSPLGRDGTQYQYDIQFVGPRRSRGVLSLFLYLSGIQRSIRLTSIDTPCVAVRAPAVGEAVQGCAWRDGVAALFWRSTSIVKLQDKSTSRMVYDGVYNIQCGVKIFGGANSISDKDRQIRDQIAGCTVL